MFKKILLIIILLGLWLFLIYLFSGRADGEKISEASESDLFLKAPITLYLPYRYVLSSFSDKPYLEAKLTHYEGSKSWIKNVIISKAEQNGIPADLFLKIAKCESNLIPTAKNKTSSASGIFQFLNSTFSMVQKELGRKLDVFNPVHNAEAAAYLYSKQGIKPWLASRNCWE